MKWTQPLCAACWAATYPHRDQIRVTTPEIEQCCVCGHPTRAGIYVRRDPATVPYPTTETGAS